MGERGSLPSSKTYEEVREAKTIAEQANERLRATGAVPLEQLFDLSHLRAEQFLVYDSMADAAGIFIQKLSDGNKPVRQHFRHPFVYQISPNCGQFTLHPARLEKFPDEYEANQKCIRELFRLMEEYGEAGDEFELYSCWIGEETEPKKSSNTIELQKFTIDREFELKDREYIVVKL